MMVLVRQIRTEKSILGSLYLNGAFVCYTLENAAKAIPTGCYNVQNSKSTKFKRELPLVYNATVKASRGIRIHRGNTWEDSAGCILVGMSHNSEAYKPGVEPAVFESANAETMVTMLCRNENRLAIYEPQ
ncbi:DUF5675 family protein [Fibrobacter sp. UWH4]|uniref:DUF5675 family protein n=1 Tax=Fibrobacter sp. UWH4 TaxID=1896210 RepID=UPI000917B2B7|nr:DUF5675 family protein [Fibrobacter sp. UWH4]SHL04147.1 hypothetical protein SAMN05720762_10441 [Fibrobacter sp. UWH4]